VDEKRIREENERECLCWQKKKRKRGEETGETSLLTLRTKKFFLFFLYC